MPISRRRRFTTKPTTPATPIAASASASRPREPETLAMIREPVSQYFRLSSSGWMRDDQSWVQRLDERADAGGERALIHLHAREQPQVPLPPRPRRQIQVAGGHVRRIRDVRVPRDAYHLQRRIAHHHHPTDCVLAGPVTTRGGFRDHHGARRSDQIVRREAPPLHDRHPEQREVLRPNSVVSRPRGPAPAAAGGMSPGYARATAARDRRGRRRARREAPRSSSSMPCWKAAARSPSRPDPRNDTDTTATCRSRSRGSRVSAVWSARSSSAADTSRTMQPATCTVIKPPRTQPVRPWAISSSRFSDARTSGRDAWQGRHQTADERRDGGERRARTRTRWTSAARSRRSGVMAAGRLRDGPGDQGVERPPGQERAARPPAAATTTRPRSGAAGPAVVVRRPHRQADGDLMACAPRRGRAARWRRCRTRQQIRPKPMSTTAPSSGLRGARTAATRRPPAPQSGAVVRRASPDRSAPQSWARSARTVATGRPPAGGDRPW